MTRDDWMNKATVLRRSKHGNLYHRDGCRHLTEASIPWIWAEGRTRAEVEDSHRNGLRPCKTCDPLGALPETIR